LSPANTGAGRVLVVGDVMIDIIARSEGPLVSGSDRRARILMRQGGSGANQAVWLAHYGVAVDFVGRVGAGDLAAQKAIFRRAGVTPWLIGDAQYETGRLIALIDRDGERSFLTDRAANEALEHRDITRAPIETAALMHLSGYSFFAPKPRAAVAAAMARAKALGIPVSIDPASAGFLREVGAEQFVAWTAGAGLIFPNRDEAEALTGSGDEEEQLRRLAALYPIVVIKRGAKGAQMAEGEVRWSLPAASCQALDTTGAGDAFVAAFLAERLRGSLPEHCLAQAIAAGSLATQSPGGRPAPPGLTGADNPA
jgi:sugar/nucleoside kinase (ribokinase family)